MAYTNIDDPSAHFQTELYTGNSSTNAITFSGNSDMQPDLVWNKRIDGSNNHRLWDSSRGVTKYLTPDISAVEGTFGYVSSFDSNGVTFGSSDYTVNNSGSSFVLWNWKANGGTTSSNTDGSLTSTVQANTDAGFSIVTYTAADDEEDVGHGLGVAPKVIMVQRIAIDGVAVSGGLTTHFSFLPYSSLYSGTKGQEMYLATTAGLNNASNSSRNNISSIGASTFRTGTANFITITVANGAYVAYCWAEVQGYSKFGKYLGRGDANGPFIYTGFKPAFVLTKRITYNGAGATGSWYMHDSKRSPSNPVARALRADVPNVEIASTVHMDMLSNGFKIRRSAYPISNMNGIGSTYIFMAFAENPFVTSTGVPATAR
jgi:hypothetical protein